MKRLLAFPFALILAFLLGTAAMAAEWTPVNDELDIDYQTHVLRVYVTGKDWGQMSAAGRKMAYEYIGTLTDGNDNIKLVDIFKTRKAMSSKTQALLKDNMREENSMRLDDGTLSIYYLFDLKLIKSLFPNVNMPTQ